MQNRNQCLDKIDDIIYSIEVELRDGYNNNLLECIENLKLIKECILKDSKNG